MLPSPDLESKKRSASVFDEGSEPEEVKRLKVAPSVELKKFARFGGPDLSDLRGFGYEEEDMDGSTSSSTRKRSRSGKQSDSTSRSGPYNADFRGKLQDSGIFLPRSDLPKPQNFRELKRCIQDYKTPVARGAYEQLEHFVDELSDEAEVMKKVIPLLEGTPDDIYYSVGDKVYAMDPIVEDGADAKPDLFDGERESDVPRWVQDKANNHIKPLSGSCPMIPNFLLEAKGAKGQAHVLKLQACHGGALGTRAMDTFRQLCNLPPDENARCFSATYHNGTSTLELYAHHSVDNSYYMTRIEMFSMAKGEDEFEAGVTAFRALRHRARVERQSLLKAAKKPRPRATGNNASMLNRHTSPDELHAPMTAQPLGQLTPLTSTARTPNSPQTSPDRHGRDGRALLATTGKSAADKSQGRRMFEPPGRRKDSVGGNGNGNERSE
jgi:hypothetical protein